MISQDVTTEDDSRSPGSLEPIAAADVDAPTAGDGATADGPVAAQPTTTRIENAIAGAVAAERVDVSDSLVGAAAAGELRAKDTLILLGAAGSVEGENVRVLLTPPLAVLLGAAFGLTVAVVGKVLGRGG